MVNGFNIYESSTKTVQSISNLNNDARYLKNLILNGGIGNEES